MPTLLDALYKEYNELKDKLDKVSDLIISYGGIIPETITQLTDFEHERLERAILSDVFPFKGTWKEKIVFVLYNIGKPVTAKEIAAAIWKSENELGLSPDFTEEHVQNMVTQYTSAMGKNGDINVDKSEFRNKYYLPR